MEAGSSDIPSDDEHVVHPVPVAALDKAAREDFNGSVALNRVDLNRDETGPDSARRNGTRQRSCLR